MIVVGQFSKDSSNAVGAIGATTSLTHLFINFFMGFSVGATVLVARYFGLKNDAFFRRLGHEACEKLVKQKEFTEQKINKNKEEI